MPMKPGDFTQLATRILRKIYFTVTHDCHHSFNRTTPRRNCEGGLGIGTGTNQETLPRINPGFIDYGRDGSE
jgi:hypothetical protein